MTIETFTMEEVDEEIMQIVNQVSGGETKETAKPSIKDAIMGLVNSKRNGKNGNQNTPTQ